MKVILENVTKKFPSRNKNTSDVYAVNDFSLEFPDGKLIALLGPSGCGKSTTLNLISGLLKVTDGKVFFGDEDVTDLAAEKRGVGLVFQNYALYPHLTVRQNILFPLQNLKGKEKMSKSEMNEKAENIAKLVQVDNLMDRNRLSFRAVSSRELPSQEPLSKCLRFCFLTSRFPILMQDSDSGQEKK